MNRAKQASRISGRKFLRQTFVDVQQELEVKLRSSRNITHDGTLGAVNENHWLKVFRAYLPERYAVHSGIIIDSQGQTSDQIDIVIYDLHFTPTLLSRDGMRYIPAEAVYAIFEAKPHIDKGYLEYAAEKAKSVRDLYRTSVAITHIDGTSPPKKPFAIVAGIVAAKANWNDGLGKSFRKVLGGLKGSQQLNCGCALAHGSFDTFDPKGALTCSPSSGALIFFLFRLLKKLQSLGSVPAINWNAYSTALEQSSFSDTKGRKQHGHP